MSELSKKDVRVSLEVDGNINDAVIDIRGSAIGKTGGGRISASVSTETELPTGFRLGLLPYVLVTGQPSLSENLDGADNPFIRTGGEYKAVRTLDIGKFGKLRTEYEVTRKEIGELRAQFHVEGSVTVPRLKRILPTFETWTPLGAGEHHGQFPLVWETESGEFIPGRTETFYHLPNGETVNSVTYRYINIDITDMNKRLSQEERIIVYPERGFSKHLIQN